MGAWVTPLVVGVSIGSQAVGFLGWASSNARKPLMLVDSVMRVAFPHFSRLQDDRAEVERMIRRYLTYLLLAAGLWFMLIAVSARTLVPFVFTDKWSPAVTALILFSGAMAGDLLSWVLGMSLNGLGQAGRVTVAVLIRGVVYICLALALVFPVGMNGVATAALVSSATGVPVLLGGFGAGAWRRLLLPVSWVVVPIGLAGLTGAVALLLPLSGASSGLVAAVSTVGAFAAVVYFARGRISAPLVVPAASRATLVRE
jgi:O-antigen/teichoic acid export membrane protein